MIPNRYCIHRAITKEGQILAMIYPETTFGWLFERSLSKEQWEFIGKEMGWIPK